MAFEVIEDFPIHVPIGNELRVELQLLDEVTKRPIPLDGYGAKAQARPTRESSTAWITATVDNGQIVIGEEGAIALIVPGSVTEDIPVGTGVYSLELWPDNDEDRAFIALTGPIQAQIDITR